MQHRGSFNPLILSVWKKNGKPVGLVDMVLRNIIASFRWNALQWNIGEESPTELDQNSNLFLFALKKSPDGAGGCV